LPIHSSISSSFGGSSSTAAAALLCSSGGAATAAAGAPQRHLANRHVMRVSGSDSYALLFMFLRDLQKDNPTRNGYHLPTELITMPMMIMTGVWMRLDYGKYTLLCSHRYFQTPLGPTTVSVLNAAVRLMYTTVFWRIRLK